MTDSPNSTFSGSSVMADSTIPDKEPSLPCADVANVDPLREMSSESLGKDDVRVKMEGPEFDSHLQLLLHA